MVITCVCGARYKVPEAAIGKRLRCKKCAAPIEVGEPETYDFSGGLSLDALATGAAVVRPSVAEPAMEADAALEALPQIRTAYAAPPPAAISSGGKPSLAGCSAAYVKSLGRSVRALFQLGNFITLAILGMAMAATVIISFSGIFAVGNYLLYGYFAAFMLTAIQDAAAGEDDLTQPPLTDGLWDGILWPGLQYGICRLLVQIPAIGYVLFRVFAADADEELLFAIVDPVGAVDTLGLTAELAVFLVLLLLGAFFFPMILLVVAVGGSMVAVLRLDLIVQTIARTLPGYMLTVIAVYIALALPVGGAMLLEAAMNDKPTLGQVLLVQGGLLFVSTIATVIAMRATGLYYHHFKAHFAWSWG